MISLEWGWGVIHVCPWVHGQAIGRRVAHAEKKGRRQSGRVVGFHQVLQCIRQPFQGRQLGHLFHSHQRLVHFEIAALVQVVKLSGNP